MRRKTRRRPTGARRATFAAVALMLGGGGLVTANVYASATEGGSGGAQEQRPYRSDGDQVPASGASTISCPDVGQQLTDVPDTARAKVDKELANLDQQVTEAYARLTSTRQEQAQDTGFVHNAILGPLKEKRTAVIDRIKMDLQQASADVPDSLSGLAACTESSAGQGQNGNGGSQQQNNGGDQATASPSAGATAGAGRQQDNGNGAAGPVAADFVDITKVAPNVQGKPDKGNNASTGTFSLNCGVNANENRNTDNLIVAPGVNNGAHHTHDYVGNQDVNAFSSNDTLAKASTTCSEQGDKSAYYWPVLRLQDGTQEKDANQLGGGKEGNVGKILRAESAQITYVGNPTSKVVAMPTFLRIITGDAKAATNGAANANAHWSCTGFEDKVQLTNQYPLCPQGSKVVRTFAFQSCWDGQNIDSANHRTHVAFADPASGACPNGFKAIPQLTQRLVYDVPTPTIANGQVKNPYAVDGFPEELHKAITDHDDFISVMDQNLMNRVVDCINNGKQCGGAGADSGKQPQDKPTASLEAGTGAGGKGGADHGTSGGKEMPQPSATTRTAESAVGGSATGQDSAAAPKADRTSSPAESSGSSNEASGDRGPTATVPPNGSNDAPGSATTSPGGTSVTGGGSSAAGSQTEPQSAGDLAETGTTLWPAAAGAALMIAGLVLLLVKRRRLV
ncbi:DUF1996 domain-containing protein [Streptomyces sediminimaris]|uniref:DUF1996 domain-containing protein n=1 Tax=Streptomyces sediminimaris TaxID=3383721 RepID=UPI003999E716